MGVAVYVRVAVDKPTAETGGIGEQLQAMLAFCDRLGWRIVVEYVERGGGRVTQHRPLFEALLIAAAHNSFHAVVVEKTDRLSCSRAEFKTMRTNLEQRGVSLIETYKDSHSDRS